MNSKTNKKGVTTLQDAMFEQKRQQVMEIELMARYHKANYDIMYYSMECDKMSGDYNILLDKISAREKEGMIESFKDNIVPISDEDVTRLKAEGVIE